jgi:hypothetical protein
MSNSSFRPDLPGDEEIETTFRRLRQDGHSRQEAVRLILDELDVSLAEAKRLLARNDTWREVEMAIGPETETDGDGGARDDPVPPAPG